MAKKTLTITDFQETGITNNLRGSSGAGMIKHFDNRTKGKLQPYRDTTAAETKSLLIGKFALAPLIGSPTGAIIWGLGVSSTNPAIYYSSNGTSWSTPSNNSGSTGAVDYSSFIFYKDYLYCYENGTIIGRFGTISGGSPTYGTFQTLNTAFNNPAQSVHHPADDTLYFATDNRIHKLNDAAWTEDALVLPSDVYITSMTPFGNYLAIAVAPLSTVGHSTVYLWDRDSGLSTISQKIDWGEGKCFAIGEINGLLVGVTNEYLNHTFDEDISRLVVRASSGSTSRITNFLEADDSNINSGGGGVLGDADSLVTNEKMYFYASLLQRGEQNSGIWAVDERGRFTLEFVEEDNTPTTGVNGITSFMNQANRWWFAHSDDGSVSRTTSTALYTYTSVYETRIFSAKEMTDWVDLVGATVKTEALPTAGQIVLQFKADEDTSWTTMATFTTDDAVLHSITKSASATAPDVSKEIQFRIESTGGAVVTGFQVTLDEINKQPYA